MAHWKQHLKVRGGLTCCNSPCHRYLGNSSLSIVGDYMFFGIELTLGPFLSSTYKPDYDQFIWEGFVTITPKQISGPLWEEFAQDVIDDFQVPVWNDWPRLPANTSTEDVDPYAGRVTWQLWICRPICRYTLIARFMGPIRGPPGTASTQVGPMLATWTLLSGVIYQP